MIGFVTIGTNDIEKTCKFYDNLLGEIGAKRFIDTGTWVSWSLTSDSPSKSAGFCVITPNEDQQANPGIGNMVALPLESDSRVDEMFNKALELGGHSVLVPTRFDSTVYSCRFRDSDNNLICFYCIKT